MVGGGENSEGDGGEKSRFQNLCHNGKLRGVGAARVGIGGSEGCVIEWVCRCAKLKRHFSTGCHRTRANSPFPLFVPFAPVSF